MSRRRNRGRQSFILLVEDDEGLSSGLRFALREFGEVVPCWRVKEAIEVLRLQRFDLVITDVDLPDGSGFQVREAVGNIPVIVMTGRVCNEVLKAAAKGQLWDFIEKPFEFSEMKRAVRLALAEDRSANWSSLEDSLWKVIKKD